MPIAASAANASNPPLELSLPPSVTGPVYGILSLDLHEVILHELTQQVDGGTKVDPPGADDNTAAKFRVVWWGDPAAKHALSTQPLLTPANTATPFDKSSIAYNIRCTPPKFLKYLNDARSVSLRTVASPADHNRAVETCKLPLQPAVAEARAGGTMAVRIEGCFPLHTSHGEGSTRKLRVKLSVLWKTNAPHQFPVIIRPPPSTGESAAHTANKVPPACNSRTLSPPPPPPSHTSGGISSTTPSYGNFLEANYGDAHPSSRQYPTTTYRPPPPVMELPAPSPTYPFGPTPSPYSRFISPAATVDGPTPSTNNGPYDGSMLSRQSSGASLPDPSQIGHPAHQPSPQRASRPPAAAAVPNAPVSRTKTSDNDKPDTCLSTALQLAAVYSEPFGFLPSSSGIRPSDRHWADLLAADPMFEGARSGASAEIDTAGKYDSRWKQQQHPQEYRPDTPKDTGGSKVTPSSESRTGRRRRRPRPRERSVDRSAKKKTSSGPMGTVASIPTISDDDIWVYMAVQSLTPADGGPPLPKDLIVRLKGGGGDSDGTATQELHTSPRDGYGYYGDAELCDLAIISSSLVVSENKPESGGIGQQPKVQAAVELWQGEYQLYGVGRVSLDLGPRDLAALSHNALVRMEALVDCVSGWSGAILATCQLLVDISTNRRPLGGALSARQKRCQSIKRRQDREDQPPAHHHQPDVAADPAPKPLASSLIRLEDARPRPEPPPARIVDSTVPEHQSGIKSNEMSHHEAGDEVVEMETSPLEADAPTASTHTEVAFDIDYDGMSTSDTLTLARALNLMGERVKHLTSSGARYTEAADGADELRAPTSRDESQDAAASAFTEASSSQNHPRVTQTIHIKPCGELEAETQSSDRRASNRQEPEASVQNADVISDGAPDGSRMTETGRDGDCSTTLNYVVPPLDAVPTSDTPAVGASVESAIIQVGGIGVGPVVDDEPFSGEREFMLHPGSKGNATNIDYERVPYADVQTLLRVLTLMDEKVRYLANRDDTAEVIDGGEITSAVPVTLGPITEDTIPTMIGYERPNSSQCELPDHSSGNGQGEDQGVPVGKEEIQDGHPSIERTQCDRRQIVHVDGVMDDTSCIKDSCRTLAHEDVCGGNSTVKRINNLTRRIAELEASTVNRNTPTPPGMEEHVEVVHYAVARPGSFTPPPPSDNVVEGDVVAAVEEKTSPSSTAMLQSTIIDPPQESRELHLPAAVGDSHGMMVPESSPTRMVDEEISNPNSSLQEHSHVQVQTSPTILQMEVGVDSEGGHSWLEEDDTPTMRDISVSPELVLEPVVMSPREVREAYLMETQQSSSKAVTAIVKHSPPSSPPRPSPTPVVDMEAVLQLTKLNNRIAHLEVTANEVAAKYKEAESRLLLRHGYPPALGQPPHHPLPSESWIPLSDKRPAGYGIVDSRGWSSNQLAVAGIPQDREKPRVDHEPGVSFNPRHDKCPQLRPIPQPLPLNRGPLSPTGAKFARCHTKTPASVRLEMRRSLVRDAKRVAAILRGRERMMATDDDDDDDTD